MLLLRYIQFLSSNFRFLTMSWTIIIINSGGGELRAGVGLK